MNQEAVWKPLPTQALALSCPATELLFGGSKGGGKPLALDTPVPTPTGWSSQGELQAGDKVIAADGSIATVLGNTGPMFGRKCYRMCFSDGTSIVCDSEHPWSTLTHADRVALPKRTEAFRAARRAARPRRGKGKRPDVVISNAILAARSILPPPKSQVRTTEEILKTLYVGKKNKVCNHSIEIHAPAQLPPVSLPVPPYTLGAWLGDGTSADGGITCADPEILENIAADGFVVSPRPSDRLSFGVLKLKGRLRDAGVLGAKHIPVVYRRASVEQRIELLRGLMDTDGWCEEDGTCFFVSTNKRLFVNFVELVRSLGIVVRTRTSVATCTNSKTRATSIAHKATFVTSIPVFRLTRKLARQNLTPHVRWTRRFITKIEPVESVPVCCIKTDRADGLYVAGEQWITTHNTAYLVTCWVSILHAAHEKYVKTGKKQHKCRIMIFRKNLEDLKDFIAKTHEIYPFVDPSAHYHVNDKTWTFDSGATIACRHLDGPTDHLGYNGNEFVGLGFDEVQQISYEAYSFLVAQVRSSDPDYRKLLKVRATANPGGEDWVAKHFFIDEQPVGGKIFTVPVTLPDGRVIENTRVFIRSFLKDNPYIDPDGTYEARLRATMSDDEVAMYLEGDFFRVAGSFFSKFLRNNIHFQKSRPVPSSWEFRYAIDWGSTNPACWLLGAKDGDGCLWIIDELHKPGGTGRKFGEDLDERFRHQKWCSDRTFRNDDFWGVIDKQAMDKHGGDETAGAGIMQWGFRLFEAKKDRHAGCNQMKERLMMDRHGKPQVIIFEDRCPNLVRALSGIKSQAPKDPDDYDDGSGMSHAADTFRFLCMEFPLIPQREMDARDLEVARWERYISQARQRQRPDEYGTSGGYGS